MCKLFSSEAVGVEEEGCKQLDTKCNIVPGVFQEQQRNLVRPKVGLGFILIKMWTSICIGWPRVRTAQQLPQ